MQEMKRWALMLLVITDLKHKNDNQKGDKKTCQMYLSSISKEVSHHSYRPAQKDLW